ncbi:MAG: response regulator transcription factor [Oscillospiraceae bacterium]
MIYYVEDDNSIRELVIYTLKSTGFEAVGLSSGDELLEVLKKETPELLLLDIMLPNENGIEILKKLKNDDKYKKIPIIMVTAKGSEYDKVIGLDFGADDYITKPFGMMELVSRCKAVLRRTQDEISKNDFSYNNVAINIDAHSVTVGGKKIELTLKEFEILALLLKNKGKVLTRDMLLKNIWDYDFDGETRTVDVHIRTLRSKLLNSGDIIETIRGVGYRIG